MNIKLSEFNMLLVLVVLYYNAILAGSAGTPIMEFKMFSSGNNQECRSTYMTLYEGQPLEIRYSNAYTLRCYDCVNRNQITIQTITIQNDVYVATVDRVPNYGNKWTCEFWDNNNLVFVGTCMAYFHLRTIKPKAQLLVNNEQPVAKTADASVWRYDAAMFYSFLEDQAVFIECRGPSDLGSAKITHSNITGQNTLKTDYLDKRMSIFLKLTKEYDGSFVDCVFDDRSDLSVTRLYLSLQDRATPQSIINLHINGLKIRIPPNEINYHHQHIYYEDEEFQITCEIRNDINLILQFGNKDNWLTKRDPYKVNETLFLKNSNSAVYFICAAVDMANDIKAFVKIHFIKNLNDFYVTGLLGGNILKQYPENRDSIVIYYQYTDGERLNLTCTKILTSDISFGITLTLDGENVRSTFTKTDYKIQRYHIFILRAGNSVIKCMGQDANNVQYSITIRLIHKKTIPTVSPDNDNGKNYNGTNNGNDASGNNNENDANKDNSTKNDNDTSGNNNNGKNNEKGGSGNNDNSTINDNDANENNESLNLNVFITKHWITLSVGIGTLVIIIIITCVIFKKKMNKEQSSNTNYTNVPSRGDPCNESRQLGAPNEQLYSNGMMNHDEQIEPVLHYAEIMPTNNKTTYTKNNAPEYAQILSKDKKTNRNENDYENICNSTRYVNCQDGKELAEPTYCEVIPTRK